MRASRINPNLSAYAQCFGQFSHNATPLAPPGTHMLIHEKPAQRASWAPHAVDAWYIGPALDHYRCYRAWVWSTRSEIISDTVTWLPKTVPFPTRTTTEVIIDSTQQLRRALAQLNTDTPVPITSTEHDAIHRFEELLTQGPLSVSADLQVMRVEPKATELPPAPVLRVVPSTSSEGGSPSVLSTISNIPHRSPSLGPSNGTPTQYPRLSPITPTSRATPASRSIFHRCRHGTTDRI
jgi:hypothetical protein